MANDSKISALPQATTGNMSMEFPVNDGGTTRKVDMQTVANTINSATGVDGAATTAALPANTYNNGANNDGVGATLTATTNGALTVDGVAAATAMQILVKDEADPTHNGLYDVTQPGDANSPYVLTRSATMNQPNHFSGAVVVVGSSGSVNADSIWCCEPYGTVTVGVSSIEFIRLDAAASSVTSAADSATAAANSANDAANSASAASVSETNAANSASAASTSASAASVSETNAANSASAAGTSATNAANSASAAGTSATNAANSATQAQSYAAAVNLPAAGTAYELYMLRVKSNGSGYELRSPTQVMSDLGAAPTANPTFTGTITGVSATLSGTLSLGSGGKIDWGAQFINGNDGQDDVTFKGNDLALGSFWGIGFTTTCSGQSIPIGLYGSWMDSRTGNWTNYGYLISYGEHRSGAARLYTQGNTVTLDVGASIPSLASSTPVAGGSGVAVNDRFYDSYGNTYTATAVSGGAVTTIRLDAAVPIFYGPSANPTALTAIGGSGTGVTVNLNWTVPNTLNLNPSGGIVTAPTPAVDDNTTKAATTAWFTGQLSNTTPAQNGSGSPGTSTRASRTDHVHPTDTSRAAVTQLQGATGSYVSGNSGTTAGTVYDVTTTFTCATKGMLVIIGAWNTNMGSGPGGSYLTELLVDGTAYPWDTPSGSSWVLSTPLLVAAGTHTITWRTTPQVALTSGLQVRGSWSFFPTL